MDDFDPYIELNHIPNTDPLWVSIAMRYPISQYQIPIQVAELMHKELYQRYQQRTT